MDICHLKNAELEPKFQKCKGRIVLRGDIVKDDSGSYAVFCEQGSSASQMTAAKVMDVIARVQDCDGQPAEEISAHPHVTMEHAPRLLKIPKSECPDFWIRLPRHKMAQHHGQTLKIQWFLVNDICTDTHVRDFFGEDSSRKFCWSLDGKKDRIRECLFVHRKQGLILSAHVDDMNMAGKKQDMAPMWKKLMKNVDLDEPTSFLDHAFLGCTQRECKLNEIIIEQYSEMFEERFSAGN